MISTSLLLFGGLTALGAHNDKGVDAGRCLPELSSAISLDKTCVLINDLKLYIFMNLFQVICQGALLPRQTKQMTKLSNLFFSNIREILPLNSIENMLF